MEFTSEAIFNRLQQGKLWDFPGGVRPTERKELSNQDSIRRLPLPDRLLIPIKQHIGVEGQLCVSTGDHVLKGQPLTRSTNPFSVPVHAPTSGTIGQIAPHVSAHPSGLAEITVELLPDGDDRWAKLNAMADYQQQPKMMVLEAICNGGISGMGGAGFPTHIKVSPKKNVEFLIINGVECEPYITSDDRLMQEHAWQIRQGIDVLCYLLNPKHIVIAVEDNKPEAANALEVAVKDKPNYLVSSVPTKYPAGGEKQLIQVLTKREVPSSGLPIDVGVIMQNVGTCYAIADAIFHGKPLIERVVTLTGEAVRHPGNVWALLGTPVAYLLAQSEYDGGQQQNQRLIMGGPMMGFTLASDQVPVVKVTNCILAPKDGELSAPEDEQPCIRCGACADACPAELLPQQLYWHSKADELEKAQEYNLFDCIECGACAYVCPSEIPLVQYYREAKADIRHQEDEKQKADKARQRFEARQQRLDREQREREEKHRKAAEARQQNASSPSNNGKVADAVARAKAKKQASAETPKTPASQNPRVAEAIARAKAKKAAQAQESAVAVEKPSAADPADDKKAQIAAAIARAKAKKVAQQSPDATDAPSTVETPASPERDKKAKVAEAIARAKAKKAALAQAQSAQAEQSEAPTQASADDEKKAKIAAAIAKAKAKRAALTQTSSVPGSNGDATATDKDGE